MPAEFAVHKLITAGNPPHNVHSLQQPLQSGFHIAPRGKEMSVSWLQAKATIELNI